MISARLVRLGLVAFLITAVFALVFTVVNPFAPAETAPHSTRTHSAAAPNGGTPPPNNATAVAINQPTAAFTPEPTARQESALPIPTIPADLAEVYQQALVHRRNGDYVRAATDFRFAARESADPAFARQAQFRLGESLYLAADFTNAVPALQAIVDENGDDEFANRAHYFLADILTQQQKYQEALPHLKLYRSRTRALFGVLDREIGDVLLAMGDSAAALKQYETAFQDTTMTPAWRVALLLKMAEVYTSRGEPELAAVRLGEAFQLAPNDASRANAEFLWGEALLAAGDRDSAVVKWKHALATYTTTAGAHRSVAKLVELGVEDINELQRGIANYSVGNYDLAIQAFRRWIAANETPGADVLYYAALAYQKQGDQAGALRNLNVLLLNYPESNRIPDALYAKAVSQIRGGSTTEALATLRLLQKQYPNDARADDGFWSAGLALEGAGNHAAAGPIFAELANSFPASNLASAALFNGGVNYYLAQDYANAQQLWQAAIEKYPATQNADGAAYWLGKLKRAQGDEAAAQTYFQQAAQPPRTYYSWRALDALNQPAPPPSYDLADYTMDDGPQARAELETWIASWSGAPAPAALPAVVLNDGLFRRGDEYVGLDRPLDARPQFQELNNKFQKDAAALYALALYYKDNNYFSNSMDAARKLADLSGQDETRQPRLLRQLTYPTYFADLIVPYAQQHGFDPYIFFGLVRQESAFNPMGISSALARGLTQVIPTTADGIARALNISDFQQTDLFKPFVSVRFGTYYLGTVLDMFEGNEYYALMGYNGGPGNARKWQRDDLDAAVEMVHLPETHLYVRTVISQYRHYADVYRNTAQ
ncbi:MAG: tetratricopeptide repeat protein [Anaerolineae bacterium]|nr:tetratricopeptide repeat protein [Anaerolineae bacterium]